MTTGPSGKYAEAEKVLHTLTTMPTSYILFPTGEECPGGAVNTPEHGTERVELPIHDNYSIPPNSPTILRAYKTEFDPNNKQRTLFKKHCGAARFAYNWALADRIDRYKQGLSTNVYEQKRRFNALKHQEFPWMQETAYKAIDCAFHNCDAAYQNFFRRVKQGAEKKGFPKKKSRKRGLGAFTLRGSIHVEPHCIKLPRIGWVRLKEHGYLPTDNVKILRATISEKAHRWYVSLQVEQARPTAKPATKPAIGVDLGIKTLATCSNGKTFANPLALRSRERKLAHLQRELCRRKKGSKNRAKTKVKVAKLHAKIANIRRDAIHKATHYLTAKAKPETVVIEDLNVAGMLKNRRLSKAISDASFGEFRRQITYKADWYGVGLVVAGRFYPSSKTCSVCGSVKPLLSLSERTFVCESCGVVIDRDVNAACNLAHMAVKPTASACGGDVSLGSAKQAPVKQELSGVYDGS